MNTATQSDAAQTTNTDAPVNQASRALNPEDAISPKTLAGALGAAIATLLWILLSKFVIPPNTFSETDLSAVTGATATIIGTIFAYVIKDPYRQPLRV
jgi:hypothetical protein